jgi:hypothetical protein
LIGLARWRHRDGGAAFGIAMPDGCVRHGSGAGSNQVKTVCRDPVLALLLGPFRGIVFFSPACSPSCRSKLRCGSIRRSAFSMMLVAASFVGLANSLGSRIPALGAERSYSIDLRACSCPSPWPSNRK